LWSARCRETGTPGAELRPGETDRSKDHNRAPGRHHHRPFAAISTNWRGRPLTSHEVIVNLIGATTNRSGLAVHAELDTHQYPKGIKVTDEQINALRITHHRFHGERNYTLPPAQRGTPMDL
jgi:hypothetical protein